MEIESIAKVKIVYPDGKEIDGIGIRFSEDDRTELKVIEPPEDSHNIYDIMENTIKLYLAAEEGAYKAIGSDYIRTTYNDYGQHDQ